MDNSSTRSVQINIKPKTTILGPRCSCGHTLSAEARTERRARLKLFGKRMAHRIRHPFRDRQSASEVMEELKDQTEEYREVVKSPSKLHGDFSPSFDIDDDNE